MYEPKYFPSLEEACKWLNTLHYPVEVVSMTRTFEYGKPGGYALLIRTL